MRRLQAQHSRICFGLVSTAIVFFFLGGLQAISAGPIYSVQIIGALGPGTSSVTAINKAGIGVGFITDSSGNQIPVTFNGQTTVLPGMGQANAINDSGTIIGTTYSNGSPKVTEWTKGQTVNTGITGYGTSINNAGQIVGGYTTAAGQSNAFVWDNGSLVNLGTLNGGVWSSANAINASGQIVGTSLTAAGVFTAFFSNGSGMSSLCPSCPSNSYANSISGGGVAVGSFVDSDGYLHAAEYGDGSAVDLGTLGGSQSAAYGIDDAGDIVGYSYIANNTATHAFLYANNVMVDLNDLLPIASGWTITAAYGINSSGEIIGQGTLDGQTYAIILASTAKDNDARSAIVPLAVPEPGPFILTAGGLALLGTRVWRRQRVKAQA